jgi:hypothetical protein
VWFPTASDDKETRAKPISAQTEAGNVKIVRGLWNDEFLRVLENFPAAKHDDEVDALSGAYERVADASTGAWTGEAVEAARRDNPRLFPQQPADGRAPLRVTPDQNLERMPRRVFTPRSLPR